MARRARKGVEPVQIIVIVAIVCAVGALGAFMANRGSDQFASLTPLPVGEYMRNANSLSGNVYKLTGTVSGKERYTERKGQFIIVEVEDGGSLIDLPLYVPVEHYGTNIDRGDPITSKVEVRSRGILELKEIQ